MNKLIIFLLNWTNLCEAFLFIFLIFRFVYTQMKKINQTMTCSYKW